MMREKGMEIDKVHMDCGIEIYDQSQDAHAGGEAGCGCSAVNAFGLYLETAGGGKVETGAVRSDRRTPEQDQLQ